jgi:hypothetical protein
VARRPAGSDHTAFYVGHWPTVSTGLESWRRDVEGHARVTHSKRSSSGSPLHPNCARCVIERIENPRIAISNGDGERGQPASNILEGVIRRTISALRNDPTRPHKTERSVRPRPHRGVCTPTTHPADGGSGGRKWPAAVLPLIPLRVLEAPRAPRGSM